MVEQLFTMSNDSAATGGSEAHDSSDSGDTGGSEAHDSSDSFEWSYYAYSRTPVIINYNEFSRDGKSTIQSREIGRVFAEYKDSLVIIDGEDKKEHAYLIPKTKVDHYGDKLVYLNISDDSLKEFEI
jgi:hypothetical protein